MCIDRKVGPLQKWRSSTIIYFQQHKEANTEGYGFDD